MFVASVRDDAFMTTVRTELTGKRMKSCPVVQLIAVTSSEEEEPSVSTGKQDDPVMVIPPDAMVKGVSVAQSIPEAEIVDGTHDVPFHAGTCPDVADDCVI